MAKFKKNDLITDGHSSLWVTEVTDTHYIFTHQDGSHTISPIDQIDKQFETYVYVRSHTQKISIEEYKGKVKVVWDVKSKEEAKILLNYVMSNFDNLSDL